MLNTPLLSVIIPVYNVENYLEKCLDSVLNQSYRNLEIITVDDCSIDGSLKILNNYAKLDDRIKIIHHEKNKGLFQARLTGVHASHGDYIAFVDSDDEITLDFYRVLIDKAEQEHADIVMGNTIMEDENHWRFRYNSNFGLTAERILVGQNIFDTFYENEGYCFSWHTVYNKIYTRKLWDKALPEYQYISGNLTMTEDIAFSTVLYYFAEKMCFIPHDGYIYYRHAAASTGISTSLQNVRSKVNDVRRVFDFIESFLKKQMVFSKYKKHFQEWKNRYFRWHSWNVKDALERFDVLQEEKDSFKAEFLQGFQKENFEFARPDDAYFTDLKTSWNHQYEEIIKLIMDSKIETISFDVFDTLILRPLWKPDDIFQLLTIAIQKQYAEYKDLPFYDIRIESETQARKLLRIEKPFCEDVVLEEIYHKMSEIYHLPLQTCLNFMRMEEQLEIELCYPRKSVKQLFELALSVGKKVVITSDMYLSKNTLETMLTKCGYSGYHAFYLSSDKRLLKSTGKLFELIISDLEIKDASQMLHIGDNWNTDILKARSCGIKAYFVPKATDIFGNWVSRLKTNDCISIYAKPQGFLANYTYAMQQLPIRCMLGVIANRYFDNPFYYSFYKNSNYNGDPYFMGLYLLGMLAFGFTKKIADDACLQGYEKLHFLSRDGYLFKQVYDMLALYYKNPPPSDYVYVSRKALLPYQIKTAHDFYDICNHMDIIQHTPQDILEMYAAVLKPLTQEDERTYRDNGILLNQNFKTMGDFVCFINVMLNISYDDTKRQDSTQSLQEYMKSIFGKHDATIDLGYSGKLQSVLCGLAEVPINAYFLYSNGYNTSYVAKKSGYHFSSYYDFLPSGSVSVRESLIIENGPSCIGYQKTATGIEPVFEENRMGYIEKYVYGELHRGVLDFTQEILTHFSDKLDMFELRGAELAAPFENFLCHATDFDRAVFSCCYMEDEVYAGLSRISLSEIWAQDMVTQGFWKQNESPVVQQQIPEELKEIYTDGVFMSFYHWINKKFPKGGKARERIKKIAGKFFK